MNQTELRQLEGLTGAQRFLDAHEDVFGGINASDTRKQLDDIVTEVQDRITVQLANVRAARGIVEGRAQFEQELRRGHMAPIAEFARAKMKGLEDGEFKALTPSAATLKGARLVQAARSMAKAAQAHLSELEAGHFPADVIVQLVAVADVVQAGLDRRAKLVAEAAGATKDIGKGLADGRTLVRTIGAIVKRTAHNDPGLLAEWRGSQRVKVKGVMPSRRRGVVGAITSAEPLVREVKAA